MVTYLKTHLLGHLSLSILTVAVTTLAFSLNVLSSEMPAPFKVGELNIENIWSRATPKTAKVGAGYLQIENTGTAPDRLIKIETTIAGHASIHEMTMTNGVMKMRRLAGGLLIPAGGTVVLKPGGNHIMFMKLGGPIQKDQPFEATLTFEKAGTVEVQFMTVRIGGTPAHAGHGD
jgi:copper(I)-binding protein